MERFNLIKLQQELDTFFTPQSSVLFARGPALTTDYIAYNFTIRNRYIPGNEAFHRYGTN